MKTNPWIRLQRVLQLLVVLGIGAAAGCSFSYTSPFMRPSEPRLSLKPAAGQALVVFVRPSGYAEAFGATIFDGEGRFLGQIPARSHFAISVPTGKPQSFWIWAENVDGVQVDPAPGKTYFVEVAPTFGWASPRMHLYAIKPGAESWSKREAWINDTQQLVPDVEGGMNYYRTNRWDDVQSNRKTVARRLAEYHGNDLSRRTLEKADGV